MGGEVCTAREATSVEALRRAIQQGSHFKTAFRAGRGWIAPMRAALNSQAGVFGAYCGCEYWVGRALLPVPNHLGKAI